MARRVLGALAWGAAFFVVGAIAGMIAINALSSNTHDRSVEAATTAIFVCGPAAGLVGAVIGAVRGGAARRGAGPGSP